VVHRQPLNSMPFQAQPVLSCWDGSKGAIALAHVRHFCDVTPLRFHPGRLSVSPTTNDDGPIVARNKNATIPLIFVGATTNPVGGQLAHSFCKWAWWRPLHCTFCMGAPFAFGCDVTERRELCNQAGGCLRLHARCWPIGGLNGSQKLAGCAANSCACAATTFFLWKASRCVDACWVCLRVGVPSGGRENRACVEGAMRL